MTLHVLCVPLPCHHKDFPLTPLQNFGKQRRQRLAQPIISRAARVRLAHATETFTGAEIEQAYIDALHLAFDEGEEPGELTVGTALTEIVPLHSLMGEKIEGLRQWARGACAQRHAPGTAAERGEEAWTVEGTGLSWKNGIRDGTHWPNSALHTGNM